ncbi:hypothetical protein Goshw_006245 [Gossypium schwendimanii]|uniref:Uncharacterized protein n=1 Tax=Gossypium schwendimanii TaxID=34291 RepID=A0A7J9N2F3_GOSSC|nr:hypothetical protein [Gossypium schwendimanii]
MFRKGSSRQNLFESDKCIDLLEHTQT